MRAAAVSALPDAVVPTWALYGERATTLAAERMHCESIAARSRLYDWEIRPHRHEAFFQILYIRRGSGEALFGARAEPIEAPCAITVPARAVHGFRFARDTDGVVVTVVEPQLERLLADSPGLAEALSVAGCQRLRAGSEAAADAERLFDAFEREFAGEAPWRVAAIGHLLSTALLLVARARLAGGGPAGPSSREESRASRHLRRFRALVDRDYRERRGIADYAADLGITPTQLNRVCRQELGTSALGVVNQRRLREAERDLVYTRLGVKEIALSLGFADTAYFSRFFAKHAGTTPTAFRERARRELAAAGRRATRRAKPS